jgi:hypothetical protein
LDIVKHPADVTVRVATIRYRIHLEVEISRGPTSELGYWILDVVILRIQSDTLS